MAFININDLTKEEINTLVSNIYTGMNCDLSALPELASNHDTMMKIIKGMEDSQLNKVVGYHFESYSTRDVAEFYLNATYEGETIRSNVNGEDITLTSADLNALFGVVEDPQEEETEGFLTLDSVNVTVDNFVQLYCRPEVGRVPKLYMKKNLLLSDYEKLVNILHRCVWSKSTSTDDMNALNAKAVFAVHHGMNINWGQVIIKSLVEFIKKKDKETGLFRTPMGYGLLISEILLTARIGLRNSVEVDYTKLLFLNTSSDRKVALKAEQKRLRTLEFNRERQQQKVVQPKKVSKKQQKPPTPSDSEEEIPLVKKVVKKVPKKKTTPVKVHKLVAKKSVLKRKAPSPISSASTSSASPIAKKTKILTPAAQEKLEDSVTSAPANRNAWHGKRIIFESSDSEEEAVVKNATSQGELHSSPPASENDQPMVVPSPEHQEGSSTSSPDRKFIRILAWRKWRVGPLTELLKNLSYFISEEEEVPRWADTEDVESCLNKDFLLSVLQKKKEKLQGKAPLVRNSPEDHVKALQEHEMDAFDAWLVEKKRKESLIKFRHSAHGEGEPSTVNDLPLVMEKLIKEWRDSLFTETVLEVIPTIIPSPPPSPKITSPQPQQKSPSLQQKTISAQNTPSHQKTSTPKSSSPSHCKPFSPPKNKSPSPQGQIIPYRHQQIISSTTSPQQKTSSPKTKNPSPCKSQPSIRSRSPSPPPSLPPQQHAPSQQHQNPSIKTSRTASPQPTPQDAATPISPQHSVASTPIRKPIFRVPSSSSDNDGFLTSSIAADETSKRRKTPPQHEEQPRRPPMPKSRGLGMPQKTESKEDKPQISFNQFVTAAEDFGGKMLDGMDQLAEINTKHHEHLTFVHNHLEELNFHFLVLLLKLVDY
ncbi:unnamed protein product [Cuscuta europaea]|uniref:Uncharacterized protein n=1 Tax=Cuscuta europaea TaxID=41803 RepID=A0A9P0ZCZ7_CUSEU|nr:unnamed protein product [Cuscuta europaea]